MLVKVSNARCLAPGLATAGEGPGESRSWRRRRVVGILESAVTGERRLVHEVRYDGLTCRYRLDGPDPGGCSDPRPHESGGCWVEDDGTAVSYRPFCHLILDRLARSVRDDTFRLHRLPGMPPSRTLSRRARRRGGPCTLVVLDACLPAEGGLWVEVAVGGEEGERGWLPVAATNGSGGIPRTPAAGEGARVRTRHDFRMEERDGGRYRAA